VEKTTLPKSALSKLMLKAPASVFWSSSGKFPALSAKVFGTMLVIFAPFAFSLTKNLSVSTRISFWLGTAAISAVAASAISWAAKGDSSGVATGFAGSAISGTPKSVFSPFMAASESCFAFSIASSIAFFCSSACAISCCLFELCIDQTNKSTNKIMPMAVFLLIVKAPYPIPLLNLLLHHIRNGALMQIEE